MNKASPELRAVARVCTLAILAILLMAGRPAMAELAASVTLASGQPTDIYPGGATQLQITLSNNSTVSTINMLGFSNSLPGTLPNGLKIAGTATYNCIDPLTHTTAAGSGTLTAAAGSQAIALNNGIIPRRANNTDGSCIIVIPVTAGTSNGAAATYSYTIADGAVTGNDGSPEANRARSARASMCARYPVPPSPRPSVIRQLF